MLVTTILSGEVELEVKHSQAKTLDNAVQNLRNFDSAITITLDSGKKIIISKVLEGGDSSDTLLSVTISG